MPPHCRVRQDKVHSGNITLRYKSTLYHVAVGRQHDKKAVLILVANRDIRIMTPDGYYPSDGSAKYADSLVLR